MKLMILTRKKLIVMGCCVLMAVVTLAVSLGSYGRAIETSTSERKIPIYNVDTTEKVYKELGKAGIEIPFQQIDVHIK